jgi:hypothetical protein
MRQEENIAVEHFRVLLSSKLTYTSCPASDNARRTDLTAAAPHITTLIAREKDALPGVSSISVGDQGRAISHNRYQALDEATRGTPLLLKEQE